MHQAFFGMSPSRLRLLRTYKRKPSMRSVETRIVDTDGQWRDVWRVYEAACSACDEWGIDFRLIACEASELWEKEPICKECDQFIAMHRK